MIYSHARGITDPILHAITSLGTSGDRAEIANQKLEKIKGERQELRKLFQGVQECYETIIETHRPSLTTDDSKKQLDSICLEISHAHGDTIKVYDNLLDLYERAYKEDINRVSDELNMISEKQSLLYDLDEKIGKIFVKQREIIRTHSQMFNLFADHYAKNLDPYKKKRLVNKFNFLNQRNLFKKFDFLYPKNDKKTKEINYNKILFKDGINQTTKNELKSLESYAKSMIYFQTKFVFESILQCLGSVAVPKRKVQLADEKLEQKEIERHRKKIKDLLQRVDDCYKKSVKVHCSSLTDPAMIDNLNQIYSNISRACKETAKAYDELLKLYKNHYQILQNLDKDKEMFLFENQNLLYESYKKIEAIRCKQKNIFDAQTQLSKFLINPHSEPLSPNYARIKEVLFWIFAILTLGGVPLLAFLASRLSHSYDSGDLHQKDLTD